MDRIYNRMRRLLPVATNNKQRTNEQHPKNRAIQIFFVELFFVLVEIWSLAILDIVSHRVTIGRYNQSTSHCTTQKASSRQTNNPSFFLLLPVLIYILAMLFISIEITMQHADTVVGSCPLVLPTLHCTLMTSCPPPQRPPPVCCKSKSNAHSKLKSVK